MLHHNLFIMFEYTVHLIYCPFVFTFSQFLWQFVTFNLEIYILKVLLSVSSDLTFIVLFHISTFNKESVFVLCLLVCRLPSCSNLSISNFRDVEVSPQFFVYSILIFLPAHFHSQYLCFSQRLLVSFFSFSSRWHFFSTVQKSNISLG